MKVTRRTLKAICTIKPISHVCAIIDGRMPTFEVAEKTITDDLMVIWTKCGRIFVLPFEPQAYQQAGDRGMWMDRNTFLSW